MTKRPAGNSWPAAKIQVHLPERPSPAYNLTMDNVTLPPELEQFAAEAVANGRYRDVAEVIQAGVSLLRQAAAEVVEFEASLEEARAEGERDGFFTGEEVERRVRAVITDTAARRA